MGKNWKETIAKEKLSDKDIDEAFNLLLEARKKATASQSAAEPPKETDEADDSAAQEPSQPNANKEFFTMDEVDKLIAKKVEEKLKKMKPQDADPLQVPSFVNTKAPAAFKVLKMKNE